MQLIDLTLDRSKSLRILLQEAPSDLSPINNPRDKIPSCYP